MRARRIIEGASFGPEVLKVASDAFEAAWHEIAERFDPSMHEAVRENLAQVIISATREDSRDVELLRAGGLRALARLYPTQFAPPQSDASADKMGE
jgi:hypothetical protein